MKKFLFVIILIVAALAVVDKFVLKEEGVFKEAEQMKKYDKMENLDSLDVGLNEGYKAPDFTLNDLNGNSVTLGDYKGKKILLNYWATWCPPCKAEMPDMQSLYEKHKEDDFVVLAINLTHTEDNLEAVTEFVNDNKLTFPILLDEKGKVSSQFEVLSYPTSYFIDSDGVVRSRVIGALSKEYMYKEMAKLP